MESSAPMQPNDTAHLISPSYTPQSGGPLCLQFYYHMYGIHVGSLNVYMTPGGASSNKGNAIWTRSFNQGNVWRRGQVTLNPSGSYQVRQMVFYSYILYSVFCYEFLKNFDVLETNLGI